MMSKFTHMLLAIAAASFVATGALAGPGNFQAGGNGPNKVLKVQLGIKGPTTTACPATATTTGWVFTNYAGPVQVMIARKGQSVGAPFVIQAKKAANGQYMATFSRKVTINGPMNAEYRLLAQGEVSNWVPLKASCTTGQPAPGFKAGG